MKLTKLTFTVVAAALTLGAFGVKAAPGTVTNYSKLNISIVVKTNKTTVTSGNVEKTAVGTTKFNTKNLLSLIESSTWADTTFPAGAQLVVGWDSEWDGDILVVDKTGTNVLFDASDESASFNDDAYIEVYYEYDGAYTETYVDADPGSDSWKETLSYEFYLVDNDINLYLWTYYTPGTQKFSQKWDANGKYTTWSDSESINVAGGGDQELNNNSKGSMSGSVKLSGKGKGENTYWY